MSTDTDLEGPGAGCLEEVTTTDDELVHRKLLPVLEDERQIGEEA